MLMPSSGGKEIDVALSAGFSAGRLHLINDNPALLASIKARRFSRVNNYGIHLANAKDRLRRASRCGVRLTAANLDFTSGLSASVLRSITALTSSGILDPLGAVVAVTLLRGREGEMVSVSGGVMKFADAAKADAHHCRAGLSSKDFDHRSFSDGDVCRLWAVKRMLEADDAFRQINVSTIFRAGTYRSNAGTQSMLWMVIGVMSLPVSRAMSTKVSGPVGNHNETWIEFSLEARRAS